MSALYERTAQLVACAFQLTTDSGAIAARLDDMVARARQEHPILHRHQFSVRRRGGALVVSEDAAVDTVASDDEAAVQLVDRRMHELAMAALADRTKLHAGCGVWHDRRFLVVGRRGAGKTTLMTRLLKEDVRVEGDELVLLRDREAVAYPRRFGVRRLTLSLIPEVGALAPHLLIGPEASRPGGYHVLALDPAQLNVPWRIGCGPVDAVFFLGPRSDGASTVEAVDTASALQLLTEQSAAPVSGSGAWIRDLSALMRSAQLFSLRVGDLDSGVICMRKCVPVR
ncbi:MAG: hypothetical protein AB7Q29_04395 [Vicinamibacterales bacterium]